jgi:large subunit ribosomal protein L32e
MEAIKLRKKLKSRKPKFFMTGFGERGRIKKRWRQARGSDNKIRQNLKGYPKRVKIGYGGPKAARDLHPSGLCCVIINRIEDLKSVDAKTQGAIISGKTGNRKKTEIIKKCQEMKIKILNIKAEEYMKKADAEMQERKEEKKKKSEEKDKKKKEKEKKATEKEKEKDKKETKDEDKNLADKVEEEKNEQEQEKQKVLTKREQ